MSAEGADKSPGAVRAAIQTTSTSAFPTSLDAFGLPTSSANSTTASSTSSPTTSPALGHSYAPFGGLSSADSSNQSLWSDYPIASRRSFHTVAPRKHSALASEVTASAMAASQSQPLEEEDADMLLSEDEEREQGDSDELKEVLLGPMQPANGITPFSTPSHPHRLRHSSASSSSSSFSSKEMTGPILFSGLERRLSSSTVPPLMLCTEDKRTFNPLNPPPASNALLPPISRAESDSPGGGMQASPPLSAPRLPFALQPPPGRLALDGQSLDDMNSLNADAPPVTPTEPRQISNSIHTQSELGKSLDSSIAFMHDNPPSTPDHADAGFRSPDDAVPARRVVRRSNLIPKAKSHMRVMAQMRGEQGRPDDEEIASEAALHRLQKSAASHLTPRHMRGPRSSSSVSHTHNRFPESADDDAERDDDEDSSASETGTVDMGSDEPSTRSQSVPPFDLSLDRYKAEDEAAAAARRATAKWMGFRDQTSRTSTSRDPEEMASALSTPVSAGRPGKRKVTDSERFEPYSTMAFKRRAVSPTTSISPGPLASPVLTYSTAISPLPALPSLGMLANPTLPITIPVSPSNATSYLQSLQSSRSRATSPGTASSLSSSAGRPSALSMLHGKLASDRDEERSNKLGNAGDKLVHMRLE
ncbi:uncharacterized protein L969DRAFT_69772 [Mixia osmundae IAM 14324]|uniref:Uncharacterized protein n=1 Tax=Mixia osmundae (strain CBS 9802 / IAM 14324 / JCM 22182 / KY 12970) TaxID=764103 RepID=G7DZD9_MIXOS|nr:uncharacterized protein L969DRAFT_69772 [Mixia osmundae IAM 14324]KEI42586.1 hypothetical protein L969DRAFT_69772 [Mixia osmundae IAM 14324]GAA95949.1 hypothetical protein E5Q_02607 [Mixia osmundae IAM 14324]